ncbi:MAG: hypothetical protein WAM66_11315 [Acidobacteriaceae bacterium]
MLAPLARLLKLRRLLEESGRMELERRAVLATRIEHARERERRIILESRGRALAEICDNGQAREQAQRRTAEWASAETAGWREQQLEPLARAAKARVAEAREEFFERRKERRQVQSVLEAEQDRLRTEQQRRVQRDLDDWFGMKQIRQNRRNTRSEPPS